MPARFNINRLDPEDPFELDDDNRPHLHKHLPSSGDRLVSVDESELYEVYLYGDPSFFWARPGDEAHWLMVGEAPGIILLVPLAPPKSKDPSKCRPIGIYAPSKEQLQRYWQGNGDES